MAKQKRKQTLTPDMVAMGPEPHWTDQFDITVDEFNARIGRALTWYGYFFERKSSAKIVSEYMKANDYSKEDMAALKKAEDWRIGCTTVSLCRMIENGLTRDDGKTDYKNFISKNIAEVVRIGYSKKEEEIEESNKEDSKPKPPSIQERMAGVAREHVSEIDVHIDDFPTNGYKGEFDSYEYCKKNTINAPIAKKMLDMLRGEVEEIEEALEGKCEQLVEGYSHIKKTNLKRYAKFLRSIYDGIERYASNTKTVRKPRKTKAKPVHKVVEKVKYLKESTEYKIVSVDPTKIVGASQLWAFNAKTRTLWLYNALSRDGLSVKGTTLVGYDPETSIGKRLRKPEEVITRLLGGGKIVLRKLMDEINAVEKAANGRINDQTVLLRVI
jgi:hypothetical protein